MDTSPGIPPAQEGPSPPGEPPQAAQHVLAEVPREPTRRSRTRAGLRHTFALNLEDSRLITLVQAGAGEEATVFYEKRARTKKLLGVATPESLLRGCAFTLEDGTAITVQQVEGEDIQVWHRGWRLREVPSQGIRWVQWIMRCCSGSERVNRWLRWGRVFFFVILIALLQIGLILQGEKLEEWATTWWPVIGIGVLLYALIAAIEGFLAGWQDGDALTGTGSGCLVAGMGFLVLVVSGILAVILTAPQCQSGPEAPCGKDAIAEAVAFEVFIILFIVEGTGCVIGGLVGGWIGGLLGERCAR